MKLSDKQKSDIGELIGEATMQWKPTPTGIFQSEGASAIIDKIYKIIEDDSENRMYIDLGELGDDEIYVTVGRGHKYVASKFSNFERLEQRMPKWAKSLETVFTKGEK